MDSPLALEKMAALAAEIESGVSEGDVLAREGMSMEQWTALQDEWRTRIADGLAQGNFELTNRYNAAFLARRAALRYGPKPAAPAGSASSSSGPANHAHTLQSPSDTASGSLKTEPIPPEAKASETFGEAYAGRSSEVPGQPSSSFASHVEDEPTPAPTTPTLPAGNRPSSVPHGPPQASAPQAAAPGKKFEAREDTEPAFHLLKSAQPRPQENEEDDPPETPLVAGLPFRRARETDEATTPRMQMSTLPDALPFRPSPLSAQMNAARAEAAPAPPSQSPGRFPFAPPPPAPSRPGTMPSPAGPVPSGSPSFSAPAQHPPQHSGYLPSMPKPASAAAAGGASQYPHVPQAPPHQQNPHAYPAPMAAPSFGSGPPQPPAAPAPSAPITFGPAAPPHKTGPVAVFNPQAPQAPPAASMSSPMPGGYPPFVPPAPSFGSNNASPPGAPSFGSAPSPPTSTAPSGALPMPASLGASTSRLSLEQYAMLSAEIAISPGTSAAVRARYGLDETMHIAETGLWQRRFSADKDLFTRYSSLFQNYREWFSKAAR